MICTPKDYTIVSERGESEYKLVAFDKALLNAGIGDYNLVKVSSIIPSGCIFRDTVDIEKGSVLYTAYAEQVVQDGQLGSTAVAIAFPKQANMNGVIFETSSDNMDAEDDVLNMCKEAMCIRGREIENIKCSSIVIKGIPDEYVCGVSAVVMW